MSENRATIKVDLIKYEEIKSFYASNVVSSIGDYVDFVAKKDELTITGYSSNKSKRTVTFNGVNALAEAQKWSEDIKTEDKEKEELHYVDLGEQIGSDEVGVGDFFLPMIVVAVYMTNKQFKRLHELGVTDSKKLTDSKIKKIAPILMKEFKYSKLTLSNKKYNEMIDKGENLNSLKAKMHNRALSNLHEEYIDVIAIYVDQFVNENTYYKYLDDKDEPIVRGISFKTKGESRFPSVAAASVIARYSFLLEKEKLEKKYGLEFPLGAGKKADEFKKILLSRVNEEEYRDLVKKNFKNYSSN